MLTTIYVRVLFLAVCDKLAAATGVTWAADVAGAVILGWFISNTKDASVCSIASKEKLAVINLV